MLSTTPLQDIATIIFIGLGATAVMDTWLALLKRAGIQAGSLALVGRWVGHFRHGRFAHVAIGKSPPIPGEHLLGWITHYVVGVAFSGLLIAFVGLTWTSNPTLTPALAVGISTVAAPLLIMQPAMGLGLAASRTQTPAKNCLRSLANHAVFGVGLYWSACFAASLVEWISR